jgi:hypothetical protein
MFFFTRHSGFIASSAAPDEIFRADKQPRPATSRNFSSFHTEEGGPIVHMTRPPTADAVTLRHSRADAGHIPFQTMFLTAFLHAVLQLFDPLLQSRHTVFRIRKMNAQKAGARWCDVALNVDVFP